MLLCLLANPFRNPAAAHHTHKDVQRYTKSQQQTKQNKTKKQQEKIGKQSSKLAQHSKAKQSKTASNPTTSKQLNTQISKQSINDSKQSSQKQSKQANTSTKAIRQLETRLAMINERIKGNQRTASRQTQKQQQANNETIKLDNHQQTTQQQN